MSPDAFMALAEQLMHSAAESERRTAVSRAYYAAFHKARQLIVACGVRLTDPRFGDTEFAISQVVAAQKVTTALASVNVDEIRQPLRQYAKDILKLLIDPSP